MTKATPFLAVALLLAAAGCTSTNPNPAFQNVQTNIAGRTGQTLHWSRYDSSIQSVSNAIASLLQTNLTAQSATTIALLNNQSLQAEFEEIGISQADLAQASRLPNIEIAGSWRFPNRPPSGADVEYSAAANFLDLLKLPARKKIAARNLEQTKLAVADKVLQLAADTQTAFYEAQAHLQLMDKLRIIVEIDDAAADLAKRQHDAGNINDLEFHNQQAPSIQSHLDLMHAQAEVQLDRERLNRLLGLSGEQTRWQIAPELPPLPAEEQPAENLESLALTNRLDLAAKRAQMESVAAALRLKKNSRFFPGVKVGIDSERMPDGQRITGPTLDLEVPLFDQGQPAVARLVAEYQQARAELAAKEVNVRSEVRQAQTALSMARQAADYSQSHLLPLQKHILGETLLHYNAMQKSGFDLLLAKESEQNAEKATVEALRDYWIARVELERAIGGSLMNKMHDSETKSAKTP